MMYILRDAAGYQRGWGIGLPVTSPGLTAHEIDIDPEDYRALVLALPGWGGDYRFVKLDAQGMPQSYTPRELTPEELAADAAAALEAIKAEADTQSAAIPGWAKWTEAQVIDYITANVTDLASAKVVLVAMARMLVALRNKSWPHLQA